MSLFASLDKGQQDYRESEIAISEIGSGLSFPYFPTHYLPQIDVVHLESNKSGISFLSLEQRESFGIFIASILITSTIILIINL